MSILCFDPTSRTGANGYINYKMSGGDSGGNGGGNGCGIWFWILIILAVINGIFKLFS